MLLIEGNAYPPHPVCIRGCCWFCGGSQRTIAGRPERVFSISRYLDTDDIDVDDVGGIWICESCLGDAAGQLGFVPPAAHAALVSERDELEARASKLVEDLSEAVLLCVALRRFDERHRADAAPGPPGPAVPVRAGQTGPPRPVPPSSVTNSKGRASVRR